MSKIQWDQTGERYLESGVSRGVLYINRPHVGPTYNAYGSQSLSDDDADWPKNSYSATAYTAGNAVTVHPTKWSRIGVQLPNEIRLADGLDDITMIYTDGMAYFNLPEGGVVGYEPGQYFPVEQNGNLSYSLIHGVERLSKFDFDPTLESYEYTEGYGYWTQDEKIVDMFKYLYGGVVSLGSNPPIIADVVSFDLENNRLYLYHVSTVDGTTTIQLPNPPGGTQVIHVNPSFTEYTSAGLLARLTNDYGKNTGVAWNGLISVGSSPEGAEDNDQWADNMKYSRTKSKETWGGTIEAYQSPKEFDACDGTIEASPGVNVGQQKRNSFGLSYRTEIMSDASGGESCGYLLHLLYNLTASPSDRSYETINDSPDAITLSWELDGVPVNVDGYEPLTEITVDSRYADSDSLENLENLLYGTENSEPTLPSPEDLIALFS